MIFQIVVFQLFISVIAPKSAIWPDRASNHFSDHTIAAKHNFSADDWELVKEKDGIKVFTRSQKNSAIKAFRATVTVKASAARLTQMARDVNGYYRWIGGCKKSALLEDKGPNRKMAYLELGLPWPVSNRDMVLQIDIKEREKKGSSRITLTGKPDFTPAKEGLVRISSAEGFFSFTTTADGLTEIEYQFHADPGGSLPVSVVNAMIVQAPFETLQNLRKLAGS